MTASLPLPGPEPIAQVETAPVKGPPDPETGIEKAERRAADLAQQAGQGWQVTRRPDWPYGWQLLDPESTVKVTGPLDFIGRWLMKSRTPR
ncbi:hypothetical protein ACWDOP_14015 [Nocardia sp. NPDC003693]